MTLAHSSKGVSPLVRSHSTRVNVRRWFKGATTGQCSPPTNRSQFESQRVVAIMLGIALAALLSGIGL